MEGVSSIGEKILGYSEDEKIVYTILPDEKIEEALEVFEKSFCLYESVCICTGVARNIAAAHDLSKMNRVQIKDGVSIIAVEKSTDKVIGVLINKIHTKPISGNKGFFEEYIETHHMTPEALALMNFMIRVDNNVSIFEDYKIDKYMELVFVCVQPEYRKLGIGCNLIKYALKLLDKLNGITVATAIFTNNYSGKIGKKLNFETVAILSHNDFQFNGVKFSDKLDPVHHEILLMVKQVNTQVKT